MNEKHIATLMRAHKALDELIEAYHNCTGSSHDIRKAYRASDTLNSDIKVVAEYDSLYEPSLVCAIAALESLLEHYKRNCSQNEISVRVGVGAIIDSLNGEHYANKH